MSDTIAATSAFSGIGQNLNQSLKQAATKTGIEFDYLYKVAMRESALDTKAKATTSSAAGLFQFIEQTWLEAVKTHGAKHGMASEAALISEDARGRFVVVSKTDKEAILDARFDPQKAAGLAAELAQENKRALETRLGRNVNAAELYAAHFLGAGGATKILSAGRDTPAADLLPAAAKANRPVFYDGGRARTVGELIDSFAGSIGQSSTVKPARIATTPIPDALQKLASPSLPDQIGEIGERLREGSFNPLGDLAGTPQAALRNPVPLGVIPGSATLRASDAVTSRSGPFETATLERLAGGLQSTGLSPLALIVLQALDPTDLARGDEANGTDRTRPRETKE